MVATLPLGPALVNITGLRAGDRNAFALTVTTDGAPLDLTGLDVTCQARERATDPDPPAITAVVEVLDAPAGELLVRFPGEEVRAALGGAATWLGVWDLQVASGEDDPVTLVAGTASATQDVTR